MPLYGYVSKSVATQIAGELSLEHSDLETPPGQVLAAHPKRIDVILDTDVAAAGDLRRFWGQQIAFNQLLSAGALKKNLNGSYSGINGYTRGEERRVFDDVFERAI